MVLGQKLPDSTNNLLENRKYPYDVSDNFYYIDMLLSLFYFKVAITVREGVCIVNVTLNRD